MEWAARVPHSPARSATENRAKFSVNNMQFTGIKT